MRRLQPRIRDVIGIAYPVFGFRMSGFLHEPFVLGVGDLEAIDEVGTENHPVRGMLIEIERYGESILRLQTLGIQAVAAHQEIAARDEYHVGHRWGATG